MDENKNCFGAACGGLKTQANAPAAACKVPKNYEEDYEGCKFTILTWCHVKRF